MRLILVGGSLDTNCAALLHDQTQKSHKDSVFFLDLSLHRALLKLSSEFGLCSGQTLAIDYLFDLLSKEGVLRFI